MEPQAEEQSQPAPRIPPAVKGLGLVSLFNDFASEMVYPLLPGFITRTLGGSATILGALDGAADLAASLVKWGSGRLADRPGWRKPLILGGYLSAVLVRPLMAISSAAWQVVGFRVVDRIGKGARTPPRDALIADITPPAVAGRAFGFHRGADHLGAVLGSLTAWWLLRGDVPVRTVLSWSVVPGIVAFLVLAVVLKTAREGKAGSKSHIEGPAAVAVFWPPVLVLAAFTFFRLPEALLLLRLQDLGIPLATIPLIWAGLHVVRTASSYPGGKLVDRFGPRLAVAAGGVLFSLVALALGRPLSALGAILMFFVFGFVAGLTEPGERVLVARLSPKRGRGFGAYHGTVGIAALPAGLLYGWLYQRFGGPEALLVSAGVVLLTVVVWLALRLPETRAA
ncbi:MAG TPA: MFS transporter [Gemmatimonadales bacterium]|jgi:MFS family permease|nr:MFS transporter [Gemmatimonadales bacterium]